MWHLSYHVANACPSDVCVDAHRLSVRMTSCILLTGALGQYAAATEYAFSTIQQRTMTHPGRVRMHYGHPDLFNKMFVMTRVSLGCRSTG